MIATTSPTAMTAMVPTTCHLTALDAVLTKHTSIAPLPSVVRSIRRFAQPPLSKRFEYLLSRKSGYPTNTASDITAVEQFMLVHAEDARVEALERHSSINATASDDNALDCWLEHGAKSSKAALPRRVLEHGARIGSLPIVEWALRARTTTESIYPSLSLAISNERMAVVPLLYALVPATVDNDRTLAETAAKSGRIVALEWLYAQRSSVPDGMPRATARAAARAGHLDVIQWIHASFSASVAWDVLQEAGMHGRQHILDWFVVDARIPIGHYWIVWIAKHWLARRKLDAVLWLHSKYPKCSLPLADLDEIERIGERESVRTLLSTYPQQYVSQGLAFGARHGDLERVKAHTIGRKVNSHELKRAMHRAAGSGHLDVIEYLHAFSGGTCLPTTALWRALRLGYHDIVRFVLERKPTLRTFDRLTELRTKSDRQVPYNICGDMHALQHWLDLQLQLIVLCEELMQRQLAEVVTTAEEEG